LYLTLRNGGEWPHHPAVRAPQRIGALHEN
jgi:hypothetical protein